MSAPATTVFDVSRIRQDFPVLSRTVNGHPLVYLDSAASMQMPAPVVERMSRYMSLEHSNVHRGVHFLSQEATNSYEGARAKVAAFLNAPERNVIFTKGTTEALNLVASSYGGSVLAPGDAVLLTALEHHANIVPWQLVAERTGAHIKVVPMDDRGVLDQDAFAALLTPEVKIAAFAHVSNALGTINPVAEMCALARSKGVTTVVDGAQAVAHLKVDVAALGCDFYAFSGHKLGGPTGIGVLYGREELLCAMPPYQGGGDMIRTVSFEKTTYNDLPYKFEAGTPPIAAAIGLGAAIDYLGALGLEHLAAHEHALLEKATALLSAVPGVILHGTAPHKAAVLSFSVEGVHPHDVGSILDGEGVAVRAGHHCAQPLMKRLGVPATARASFAFYNTLEEVDALARGVRRVQEIFG